jgi:RNA recognition motif-containing protein
MRIFFTLLIIFSSVTQKITHMNIFVAKLSSETTAEDLQNLFSHYGEVQSTKVIFDKETGNSKRFGFVEMPNEAEAKEAISDLNESEFLGSTIVAKESKPREQSNRRDNRGGYNSRGGGRSNEQRRDSRKYDRERY